MLQSTLRDQFKSFVKDNIDVFDFEQFKLENSLQKPISQPYEKVDFTMTGTMTPVSRKLIESRLKQTPITQKRNQLDNDSSDFSNTQKTVDF